MTLEEYFQTQVRKLASSSRKDQDHLLIELCCEGLNLSWSDFQLTKSKRALSAPEIKGLNDWIEQWLSGKPLAYITGFKEFFGHRFICDSRALIPRHETEILVERALSYLPENGSQKVIDIGTGTGCIGLSLSKKRPDSSVLLIDASAEALELAKENAACLRLKNVSTIHGTVDRQFEMPISGWEKETIDLIVANPPYIASDDSRVEESVRAFEPNLALFAEDDGFACLKSWAHWAYRYLKPGGCYIFEFGQGQEDDLARFLGELPFSSTEILQDYSQISRFFVLTK